MASPQAQAMKDRYHGWIDTMAKNPDLGLVGNRDLSEHWGDLTTNPGGVDYLEVDAGGVQAMWAIPNGCAEDRVALCTHSVGYVAGLMYSQRKMFGHIGKAIGCKAPIVHFRGAPEHLHPAPVEDAVSAYRWLLKQGYKAEHVCTTGGSAGGALSTTVLLAARDKDLPLPVAALSMSPWYDMECKGESLKTNATKDCLANEAMVKNMAATFLGNASTIDPLANALKAGLKGRPPICIQVGGEEALLDDSLPIEKLARAAGVDIRCDVYPEMQHVFQLMAGGAPEADEAIEGTAAWVKPKLGLKRWPNTLTETLEKASR